MYKFECSCHCDHDECGRFHHPPRPPCNCIRQISKSTKFIERLIDCAETIVRVLSTCGIHECKAKAAADVIIFAFLHYDIVPDCVTDVLRKKLRKEDVIYDLGRKCRMNRLEAQLACSIIKKAFKAFYFKQTADMYNPDMVDEVQWMRAAERSAEVYAISDGLSEKERKRVEGRIKCAYYSHIQRVKSATKEDMDKKCACCYCSKCTQLGDAGYKVIPNVLPKEDEEVLQFKKRLIEEGQRYASNTPDPCGLRALEWQNNLPRKCFPTCTCGVEPCVCDLQLEACVCGKTPCDCEQSDGSNTIQWEETK